MAANVESRADAASYYDPEKNATGDYYCFSETTPLYIRHEFVKKVFGIVTLQLAASFGFLVLTFNVESMKEFFKANAVIGVVAMVIFFIISLVIACKRSLAHNKTVSASLLVCMTLCMMLYLACVAVHFAVFELTVAAGITAALTLAITLFAMQTKYDFTGWLTYLFCFGIGMIIAGILIAIFPHRAVRIVYAAIGALLMCVYLVVDIQLAVGGKKHEWTIDDYVIAAVCIYVDIISLFLHILRLIHYGNE
ncbi:N-methyl-aspartate receptor [Babesia ovata]|uniref:N-methyl-aspartate receptor n=1 Tax=Babesia ovata TaxID=189622 RepID=A0A2H6KCG7_9APIC|nr:N-methyl-aspartate receptor [Babesia ovata]GBE60688.1 N-methyl-aspartate receptor [Babesia ovata]